MARNEFDKVFLQVEGVLEPNGRVFGPEWNSVRKQQIGFMLERPLMFKILTKKVWGPAMMHNSWVDEWKETERAIHESTKHQGAEELADMTILLLTLDSLNQKLLLPSHIKLLDICSSGITGSLHKRLGLKVESLIPVVNKKIILNEIRNPSEAFVLVPNEDMENSKQRLDHNWNMLKEMRDKIPKQKSNLNWWKKWLFLDEIGWVRKIGTI